MSELKFKKGDIVKVRTTGERVMVIEYKINHTGGILNAISGNKEYADSVVTDDVLCEGVIGKTFQRKYIDEANLELWQD